MLASSLAQPTLPAEIPSLDRPLRVCAVSYLNTAPLIWGLMVSASRAVVLEEAIPSECAERLRDGRADIGLVPVAEIARQGLCIVGDTPSEGGDGNLQCAGIASDGPVRSILLFARKPWHEVRSLAGDSSSRSSIVLAQILLREQYGARVELHSEAPDLGAMLSRHDAALIIGDPALRIDPGSQPWPCFDLGQEWTAHTGLPMVFAAWAGPRAIVESVDPRMFMESLDAGMANLDAIVERESTGRGISRELASNYLRSHIRYRLGKRELAGLDEFLRRARAHGLLSPGDAIHRETLRQQTVSSDVK